jgi:DNA-binding NarL/FixJ family response regulator
MIVVLTSFGEAAHVLEAIDAGARGYILKDAAAAEVVTAVVTAIRAASAGYSPLDPRAARAIVARTAAADPKGPTRRIAVPCHHAGPAAFRDQDADVSPARMPTVTEHGP